MCGDSLARTGEQERKGGQGGSPGWGSGWEGLMLRRMVTPGIEGWMCARTGRR